MYQYPTYFLSHFLPSLTQGLYRISGVKSHVEQLCADFENNPRAVDVDKEVGVVPTLVSSPRFRSRSQSF